MPPGWFRLARRCRRSAVELLAFPVEAAALLVDKVWARVLLCALIVYGVVVLELRGRIESPGLAGRNR
jgi:hypothetical protein